MIEKNQDYIVTIEDLSVEGEGVGKVGGFPLFIKDTVIGDTVKVKAIKVKKNYGYGRLVEVLEASPDRIVPPCPVARQCGGCTLQAMSYEAQLAFKRRKIEENLRRIGGFGNIEVPPVLGMDEPWRYRNKTQAPFGTDKNGGIAAGFYAGRTHDIIDCEDCLLAPKENTGIIRAVKAFMKECGIPPYGEKTGKGVVRHVLIRNGFYTGQTLVCVVINAQSLPHADRLVKRLLALGGITSVCCNVNTKNTNVILGDRIIPLYGPAYLEDKIGELTFRISPLSFFQVNPKQTQRLYAKVLEYAGLTGNEIVWDLYCGIGTISLFLAQRAKKVYGVEIVPAAIENARENAIRNHIGNTEFLVGKAEEVLPAWYEKNQALADVIVVDPPRKGCDEALLDTVIRMSPARMVYVSCDSATLARDLKYMAKHGYAVSAVQGVDMFPWCGGHVETVVLLSRGETDSRKIRVEFSPEDMDTSGFQKEW